MTGNDLREWYGTPLRTRERAAVEVARGALRKIAQSIVIDETDDECRAVRAYAENALVRIAEILGERS